MRNPRFLPSLAVLLAALPSARADELVNGDFETPSILGPGQTEVGPGRRKSTVVDPAYNGYADAISGIPAWAYGLDGPNDPGTDLGIVAGVDFGDGDLSRKLIVNRWDRNAVQSPALTLAAGFTYTLTVRSYMVLDSPTDYKVGTLSLYAGAFQNGDPNDFGGAPPIAASRMVSEAAATGGPSEHVVLDDAWYDHTIGFTVLAGDPLVGRSLSVVMATKGGSAGITVWDDARLTAAPVPEPASLAALGLGALALLRRRRGAPAPHPRRGEGFRDRA